MKKILFSLVLSFFITTQLLKQVTTPASLQYMAFSTARALAYKFMPPKNPINVQKALTAINPPIAIQARAEDMVQRTFYYKGKKLVVTTNNENPTQEQLELYYLIQVARETQVGQ